MKLFLFCGLIAGVLACIVIRFRLKGPGSECEALSNLIHCLRFILSFEPERLHHSHKSSTSVKLSRVYKWCVVLFFAAPPLTVSPLAASCCLSDVMPCFVQIIERVVQVVPAEKKVQMKSKINLGGSTLNVVKEV